MAKRGRPAFKPTKKLRRTVEEMRSCGESENSIARAIGLNVDTLRKHFFDELETGVSKRRREVIELLFRNARRGNVSAQKTLEHMTAIAAAASDPKPPAQLGDGSKAEKLGKKDQAQADAVGAEKGTPWAGLVN